MPKIIFRPNPTPPPFPPPTPAPTENLVHITPYPFNSGDTLQVSLSNLQPFSGYLTVEFGFFSTSEGDIVVSDVIAQDGEPIPTNFEQYTGYPSNDVEYFVLNVVMQQGFDNFIRLNLV